MTQELSIDLPLSNRVANQMEISDEKNQTKKQFSVCILYPVCSLQYALCTDRFVGRTARFRVSVSAES